jgi:hypothetical protein
VHVDVNAYQGLSHFPCSEILAIRLLIIAGVIFGEVIGEEQHWRGLRGHSQHGGCAEERPCPNNRIEIKLFIKIIFLII